MPITADCRRTLIYSESADLGAKDEGLAGRAQSLETLKSDI
jgi:hypothetical protein